MSNLELIEERFGTDHIRESSHNELRFNCPFCLKKRGKADDDKKLYVNEESLKFYCFKCGSKGKIRTVSVAAESCYGVYEKLLNRSREDDSKEDSDDNMFYIPVTKISKGTVAYNYCLKRGITEELIDYYDIRLGIQDLTGRIVIPNNVYGKCWTDMYSARTVMNQIPKYKNPIGAKKNNIVFNLKNIKEGQERVIIVEGVITAICGGKDCVAVYGCHPSDSQLKQIISKYPKSIYCVLDNDDAGNSGTIQLLNWLGSSEYQGKIYRVKMPRDTDACDMGYEKFRNYIEDHKKEYIGGVYSKLRDFVDN